MDVWTYNLALDISTWWLIDTLTISAITAGLFKGYLQIFKKYIWQKKTFIDRVGYERRIKSAESPLMLGGGGCLM